jgi:hydroxymethylpyrimidine/phosphomethylpyrimidine kinase
LHHADAAAADYLAVSPLFDTPTKTDTAPAWGLDGLRHARHTTRAPLVAIGGIGADNLAEVWATGVDGVAVVRAISAAPDSGAAAAALRARMAEVRPWRVPRVLTIAGSDSGGGAGIQADIKTMAALGAHAMSAVTALTAQNSVGVLGIHAAPPEFLAQQIDAVLSDIGADAIKIGMLHDEATVAVVADALKRHPSLPAVLDPVMVATSGDALITPPTVARLREQLLGLCAVVTPNLDELGLLVGQRIGTLEAALQAAQTLIGQGARAVLVKGGHLSGDTLTDTLVDASGVRWQRSAPRLHSRNLHGTGCSLSSAIATQLARGADLVAAVDAAHHWVRQALLAGIDLRLGAGHGPLNHLHQPISLMNVENTHA